MLATHITVHASILRTLACLSVLQAFLLPGLQKTAIIWRQSTSAWPYGWLWWRISPLKGVMDKWMAYGFVIVIWPARRNSAFAQTPTLWSTLDQHGLSDRTQGEICRSLEEIKPQTIY